MMMGATFTRHREIAWRGGQTRSTSRLIAEETAIALTYNGSTHAVMMGTPGDLEDFGIGFSLTEAIVEHESEIRSIELIPNELGVEVRMWLDGDRAAFLAARRRAISGPVGCGLCGIESLEQARRAPSRVAGSGIVFHARDLLSAMQALSPLQILNQQTRSVHAAAFWHPRTGFGPVREDVGRHNALDKLAGAIVREQKSARDGAVLLTSRVSVEMVQKAAMIGAPVIVAVSAPTALAIQTAEEAGITLLAVARDDGYGVFTHPRRVLLPDEAAPRAGC
ncbi:formate dehydrogenase accessory sulfurtransferase FdhD [Bradyrhizobium cajani]|uniref:Sulfur carrier protein FdhD n=1 Tax=Bradyrhizobium cajani TaxID=1928661 RepID=A0A844SZE4_9BRAD|nr:formate dehydrogenase accessory sulfurtransferase FdhD [Bradyrhizobium cajani]MCP3368027.1 formate dehydrogenase accessory sulfurtransferase FdhD [Bradyrhizobium cajani]MVT71857.1 formate dehydrogenase accessory sulfurtransferase FdhD [Bradyrhizobium cajani]